MPKKSKNTFSAPHKRKKATSKKTNSSSWPRGGRPAEGATPSPAPERKRKSSNESPRLESQGPTNPESFDIKRSRSDAPKSGTYRPDDRPRPDRPYAKKPYSDDRSNGKRKPPAKDRNNPSYASPSLPPGPEPTVVDETTFAELGLRQSTLEAIAQLGFETPTPIQALAIPVLLTDTDLIGLAQTGTGKTAAFGLPLLEKVDLNEPTTQALILAPTRELAIQVAKGIHDFGKNIGVRVVPVYGGQPIDRQFRALRNGAHVVVGTPGRILDHLRRGSLNLESVKYCVLDEADEMMALGFTEDMEAILGQLPESRQLAFFSATMAPRVRTITEKFLREPKTIEIVARQRTLETTNQTYYEVPPGKKKEALARVLDMETPGLTIVFCRTRLDTAELSDALCLRGYNAEPIHGDMSQSERERVLKRFRDGSADLLIATDVAARGLDIDNVTHVINYDIPYDVEQYIHRIGRTGRAGKSGDAITLVYHRERRQLGNIERAIGSRIEPARIPTAADIAARRREVFVESLRETLASGEFEAMFAAVDALADEYDSMEVAAAALQMLWNERHQEDHVEPEEATYADCQQPEEGMVRIFVGMGRRDGLRPGDLVGAITNEAGLDGRQIGVIDLHDQTAFVEVPVADGPRVVDALGNTKIRNRRVKVQLAKPAFAPQDTTAPKNFGRGAKKPRK
ncbi:MAG: DEAD/DEAH box helicase [Armatimonadetes bacterium]|nr:DEAD/DEAH box helicase [Armatimonadota bacterium]